METPASELPRGTVTFLFTDIERSTELVRELGAEFGRLRSEHRRVLRDAFDRHGGHEIDTAGERASLQEPRPPRARVRGSGLS